MCKLSPLALILYVKELGPNSEKEVIKKRGEDVLGTNSQKSERCPDVQFIMQINLPHSGTSVILWIVPSVMCETDTCLKYSVTKPGFGCLVFFSLKFSLLCKYRKRKYAGMRFERKDS